MVALQLNVDHDLPIGLKDTFPTDPPDPVLLREILAKRPRHRTEPFCQRVFGLVGGVQVDEDEAAPGIKMDPLQFPLLVVEFFKLLGLRHVKERAVQIIHPSVKCTGKRPAAATGFVLDLGPPVLADIVKRSQLPVLSTDHDDQRAQNVEVEGEKISGFRNVRLASDQQPRTSPDTFLLSRVVVV